MEKIQKQRKLAEEERKQRYLNILKDNPPLPPWLKHPDIDKYDVFWRMGDGESYMMEYIHAFFSNATPEEKKHIEKSIQNQMIGRVGMINIQTNQRLNLNAAKVAMQI